MERGSEGRRGVGFCLVVGNEGIVGNFVVLFLLLVVFVLSSLK